jgi:hypothetical protein
MEAPVGVVLVALGVVLGVVLESWARRYRDRPGQAARAVWERAIEAQIGGHDRQLATVNRALGLLASADARPTAPSGPPDRDSAPTVVFSRERPQRPDLLAGVKAERVTSSPRRTVEHFERKHGGDHVTPTAVSGGAPPRAAMNSDAPGDSEIPGCPPPG